LEIKVSVQTQVAPSLIVGHNQQHIGLAIRGVIAGKVGF